jgi:hypothetical protein
VSDNVTITPGSGRTIRTDLIAGVDWQCVKLAFGADSSATLVSASNGLPVEIIAGTMTLSGEDHIGDVASNPPSILRPTVVNSTSIYAAGDSIGGKITLTNAVRVVSGRGKLTSILIVDNDNEKAGMTVLLFDANPAATTTDNAAFAWGTGDESRLLAMVTVATGNYTTFGTKAVAHLTTKDFGEIPVVANGSQNLYVYLIATATPTYTTTSDLRVAFGFERC